MRCTVIIESVSSRTPPHRFRLGLALAALALLAQLWMGQISTAHLGQLLTQVALSDDICTVQDSLPPTTVAAQQREPNDHSAVDAAMHCPVCALAAASSVASASSAHTPTLAHQPSVHFSYLPAPAQALRHASLYPPAQAPPQA